MNNFVIDGIKKKARQQLWSLETVETVIMLAVLVYMLIEVFPNLNENHLTAAVIIFFVFFGITLFGLYETIPSLVKLVSPYQAAFLRNIETDKKRDEFIKSVNTEMSGHRLFDNCDMSATRQYIVLHGERTFDIILKSEIASVNIKKYPHRIKGKGIYLMYFHTIDGKKHTLDIHMGKSFNPEGRYKEISEYLYNSMNIKVKSI